MHRVFTSLSELPELLDLAEEDCSRARLPDSLTFKAQVVLAELFVNTFKHAYQENEGPTEITLEAEKESLFIRFTDQGPTFDPLSVETPDLQKRFSDGVPGGAGLVLLRSMARDLRYFRRDNRNIVEMRITA